MTRRARAVAALGFVVAACATTAPHDPSFPFGAAAFAEHTGTVALTPVTISPDDLDVPEPMLRFVDSLIQSRMTDHGFRTVPADAYSVVWDRVLRESGGFYDPHTGARDDERFEEARTALWHALVTDHAADALLFPEIALVDAPFSEGIASWDGASQHVASFGDRLLDAISKALDAIVGEAPTSTLPAGTVPAISLVVTIEDSTGTPHYARWAGIEVVAEATTGEPLGADRVFRDRDRFLSAVERALAPLASAADTVVAR